MFYTVKQSVRDMGAPFRRNSAASGQAHKPVDWLHWTIVVTVFSITGVLSMSLSRLLLRDILQLHGDLWSGPWTYTATKVKTT